MTNQSIKLAFERLWYHVISKFNDFVGTETFETHTSDVSNPHNVTKEQIGLGNVDNTADADKSVNHATTADSATKATQDANGNVINSTYETKADASAKLTEAKTYADEAANAVKNDLLNGAGEAYDTLSELGALIDENTDALDALEAVASGKADASHTHTVSEITDLTATATELNYMDGVTSNVQTQIDGLATTVNGKAEASHTHAISDVTNLQTSLDAKQATITGAATTIASSDLTTSRALISNGSGKVAVSAVTSTELGYLSGVTSAIQTQLDGKSDSSHTHSDATTSASGFMTAAMVTKLDGIAEGATNITVDSALSSTSTNPVQNKIIYTAINDLTSAVSANTSSISSHSTAISDLQTAVNEIEEITSAEVQALFA